MEYSDAFALHFTWTCYGTWLPGDERGYVSNTILPKGGFLPKVNDITRPYTADDAVTRKNARWLQKGATVFLAQDQALQAAEALVEAAQKRNWMILRASIMPNHIHVVITNCPDNGPAVRRILKGVSQAALSKKTGAPRRWWTAGGSDRYKHGTRAIETAVNYVADQPGKLVEIVDMKVLIVDSSKRPPG